MDIDGGDAVGAPAHSVTPRPSAGGDDADAAVRERVESFRQLASSTDIGFFVRDTKNLIYMNDGFRRIFGIDPDVSCLPLVDLAPRVHADDVERVSGERAAADKGESHRFEMRVVRPDGAVRWIRSTNDPVLDAAGVQIRVAGTVEDITDRKVAETAVLASEAQADRANAARDDFLSRMSHELRTPLNAVLGFAQLLELDALSPVQAEAVGHILRGGRHLLSMIDDVLDISSIDTERLQPLLEPLLVGELLSDVIVLARPLAVEARIEIQLDADHPAAACYVLADRRRLSQVLLNLLSNAVKYNAAGGRITVSATLTGPGQVGIAVTDTGMGIAAEDLPRLFRPFERLGRQSSGIDGTGVGLALSHRLAALMGGRLGVESQVGVGSTFTVTLPLTDPSEVPGAPPGGADHAAGTPRSSVLYIEDNPSNVDLVAGILRRRPNWTMAHTASGAHGLELAEAVTPTVIMLDLHLPDMDGIDLLRALRGRPATATVPIAILSAEASAGQIRRVLAAGAQIYLTKPLDVREVLAFLDSHAAERQ